MLKINLNLPETPTSPTKPIHAGPLARRDSLLITSDEIPLVITPEEEQEKKRIAESIRLGEAHDQRLKEEQRKTPVEIVQEVRESKLKRRKTGFKKKDKATTTTVQALAVDELTKEQVSALCDTNDEIEELTNVANAIKAALGRIALDNWYGGGERSVRIRGVDSTEDEAVVSVKEKTTGTVIAMPGMLEDILNRKGIDINTMAEERTTLKIDTKIIDALDDEGEFLGALLDLANKHGVGAAITETSALLPKAGLHEERRSLGQFVASEGGGIDMEEVLPITTSVNTKVKRK